MNPFAEIIVILIDLYITIILFRFFLQYFRADFYNPVSQFVVKATDFFIRPLRRVIPGFGGIDVSSLVFAYVVVLLKLLFIFVVSSQFNIGVLFLLLYSVTDLLLSILKLFMYMILILVVISWISPGTHSPIVQVIAQVAEPVIRKFRGWLPPMEGFDFSPLVASLFLFFVSQSIKYWIVPIIMRISM